MLACVFDEVAFWRTEDSLTPDTEVYTAVLPSLITTGGMLVGISTTYRRTGLTWEKHREFFGQDSDDTLVVQGSSRQFNGTLDADAIAAQRVADPTAHASEWDAEFRTDISSFLDERLIDAATDHARGPYDLPPMTSTLYKCFVDPSGGAGHDAYTIAIGHRERDKFGKFVVDAIRGTRPKVPFNPRTVTAEYAELAKSYRISSVCGDAYSAEWVRSAWSEAHTYYNRSEIFKSQIYLEVAPLFARGLAGLPDHPILLKELRQLERHTHKSGRDTVDHGKGAGARDDYANCVAGVLHNLAAHVGGGLDYSGFLDGEPGEPKLLTPWGRAGMTAERWSRIASPPCPEDVRELFDYPRHCEDRRDMSQNKVINRR